MRKGNSSGLMNRRLISMLLIATAVVATFYPVLHADFLNYDDNEYVTENPEVLEGLTAHGVSWALTATRVANWHPLTWISHMADVSIFGLQPAGHHLVNLILHLVNSILLFLLLDLMTGLLWPAALAAILFGIHPLHVESVAWIAERKDILSTFFWMATSLCYVGYARQPSLPRYAAVCGGLVLGLAAKPMLVTLPFIFLMMDYWPLERVAKSPLSGAKEGSVSRVGNRVLFLVAEKIPLLALSLASSVITYRVQKFGGAMYKVDSYPLLIRIANALDSYLWYVMKTFWPTGLTVLYPHPGESLTVSRGLLAAVILAVITLVLFRSWKSRPYLTFGWFWYLGTLVPVIGLVQVGLQARSDRYTYVPLTGIFIIIAWGMWAVIERYPKLRTAMALVIAAALCALGVSANGQARHWKNSVTLFERATRVTEGNWLAHNNLGVAYASIERYPDAIEEYRKALAIDDSWPMPHYNLGVSLGHLDRREEEIRAYDNALREAPGNVKVLFALGAAYHNTGRFEEGAEIFRGVVAGEPRHFEAWLFLGKTYGKLNLRTKAFEAYQRAVSLRPTSPQAHRYSGNALFNLGRFQEAASAYKQAVAEQSDDAASWYNLGLVYQRLGLYEDSMKSLQKAAESAPDWPPAHFDLGKELVRAGDRQAATREWEVLRRLDPQKADVLLSLINKRWP